MNGRILSACILLCLVSGPACIFAQNEFYNDGADVYIQAGGLIFVQGEVINDDQGANIGIIHNSGDLQLEGNWTNNSLVSNVFVWNDPGTTTFLGNNAVQTIGGFTDTYFNHLTLNKPGGVREVRLLRDALTDDSSILNLTDDFLNTQSFIFGVSNPAPAAIARTGPVVPPFTNSTIEGYVTSDIGSAGRLARTMAPGSDYFFPVGTSARFRPVELTSTGIPDVGSVQFVDMAPPFQNLKDASLGLINPAWYHYISGQDPLAFADIRIYSDFGPDDICDITNLKMAEWNTATGLWDDLDPVVTSVQGPVGFLSSTTKSGYPANFANTRWVSDSFALAGLAGSCVFPVEFLGVHATPKSNSILVSWETASEYNNDGYEIERGADGRHFAPIGWQPGFNNAAGSAYTFDDKQVEVNRLYYYRIRQVDMDGGFQYSNVVNAILLAGGQFYLGEFYPNPASDFSKIDIVAPEDSEIRVSVVNALGQVLMAKEMHCAAGKNTLLLETANLSAGAYQVILKTDRFSRTRKLIVE